MTDSTTPVRIAITGAAGNIGYQLCFRIAAGDMLGATQPVVLQLIEIPPAMETLRGTVMELRDGAFPLLHDIVATAEYEEGFADADYCLLVGAKPRRKGMERKDLLTDNGKIFGPQGKAINDHAERDVRVLVVGNPANTNCLIAASNAPDLDRRQFTAMTRLDHNRALSQLAETTDSHVTEIERMAIWGNHSSTQFPDLANCTVRGTLALDLVSREWYVDTFIPKVQQRGAEIIEARGASSAASAASAAIDCVRDWALGSDDGWVSMAVFPDGGGTGAYGIDEDIVYSYPVVCEDGDYEIVDDLDRDDFARDRMRTTEEELLDERRQVEELLR